MRENDFSGHYLFHNQAVTLNSSTVIANIILSSWSSVHLLYSSLILATMAGYIFFFLALASVEENLL